ncbi:MAG TPA: hypothetical protein VFU50_03665 [Terriglobales bacterium]|nr:hypothetical protein [Terriglobales bacterium]
MSTLLVAQSLPPRNQSSGPRTHRPSIPGGVRSMKGCLVKDAENGIVLVSQRGSKVPVSSAEDLASHIGQQVKASGAFVAKDKDDPSDPNSSSKPDDKLHPEHEFRVLKIEVLAPSCAPIKKK